MNYRRRCAALSRALADKKIDGFFVTNETNVSYLSGFRGSDSMILATRKKHYFITDFRYIQDAASTLRGFEVVQVRQTTFKTVARLAATLKLNTIGFESMSLPYGVLLTLKKTINAVRFLPFKETVEALRSVKDRAELGRIKEAIRVTKAILKRAQRMCLLRKMTEERVSREIEVQCLRLGGRASFNPIVAVNANAAKPHAISENAPIRPKSIVLIDLGITLKGYCSDLTRTTLLGRIPSDIRNVYAIVEGAQRRAIEKIRPGISFSEVDLAARRFIQKSGYGKCFGHALGHGVGMEVHEAPAVAAHNHNKIREGMVFTVEPGVYIPGKYGIRIEDMVVVTKKGCEVLTQ